MIDQEALLRLKRLAELHKVVQQQTEQWWLTHISPLVESSATWDDFLRAIREVHVFDDDGQILEMPALWTVYMAYAADSFREKAKEQQVSK
jgi:hypothetical protein